MTKKYTPLSNNSASIELHIKDDKDHTFGSRSPHSPSTPIHRDKGYSRAGHSDLENDIGHDNAPLILADKRAGSNIYGAVFNLTTTIVGAGIMALPATMKVLGIILGLILIILIGILSEISVEILVRCTVHCKAESYGEVVEMALGKTARIFSEICIVVNNGGVMVVYLIILGDVLSGSLRHTGVFDQWLGHGFWDHRKLMIVVIMIVFVAPLCALDKIDSLSTTSAASVVLAVLFVLIAFIVAFIKLVEGTDERPRMGPDFSSNKAILDLLVVIPVMTNAFVCHFNVAPIYNELEGRSPEKMNQVSRMTTVICVLVYGSTAIAGYLLFGNNTESDVLTNFDTDLGVPFSSAINYLVRIGYVLHLVLVFPVMHFSLRQTMDALFFSGSPPLTESRKRCLGWTICLLAITYLGSTMIPNIWMAFKLTGATTAVSLGFTFPSLVAIKLSKGGVHLSQRERSLCWFMLILAIIVSIVGVIGNIYSLGRHLDRLLLPG